MMLYQIDNRQTPIPFEGLEADPEQRVVQNCKNLLMINRGEIPYDRLRGLSGELDEMPLRRLQEEILKEIDLALGWEPRANAVEAFCSLDDNGQVVIECVIDVRV